jgi:hypothetical protein
MKQSFIKKTLILISILLVSIACQINIGGPELPENHIPISNDAAFTAQEILENSLQTDVLNGRIAFSLTEEQLTSYLAQRLLENENQIIKNPQVYIEEGQIIIYAQFEQEIIAGNARITIEISASETDNIKISITSIDIGPIPTPQALLNAISELIDEAITGPFTNLTTGFKIENVFISDGLITIAAVKQ